MSDLSAASAILIGRSSGDMLTEEAAREQLQTLHREGSALAVLLIDVANRAMSEEGPPTTQNARDLIDGTRWLITNVF